MLDQALQRRSTNYKIWTTPAKQASPDELEKLAAAWKEYLAPKSSR